MLELPKKELLRIDEVATFFSVTDRCIRLWIAHGHLVAEKIVGSVRVTRESVLRCRFANQGVTIDPEITDEELKHISKNEGISLLNGGKAEPEPEINQAPAKKGRPSSKK